MPCIPAKWVLAGEHAVVRGGWAVVFPHRGLSLRLDAAGNDPIVSELLKVCRDWGVPRGAAEGPLGVTSTIPPGAGLGSSAALSVAVARWTLGPDAPPDRVRALATHLEDRFHGHSSGMDVAAVLSDGPILYSRSEGARLLPAGPRFSLHDTGLRASTRECVAAVVAMAEGDPARSDQLDRQMSDSARRAAAGLERYASGRPEEGLADLKSAMETAQICLEAWGLVPDEARALRETLLAQGATAAKLTGAGGGGFLVALWGETR